MPSRNKSPTPPISHFRYSPIDRRPNASLFFVHATIHHAPPINPINTKHVRIPAPARSLVVIILCGSLGFESPPVPADGSPCDVPPVLFPTGPATLSIKLLCMTSMAFICCPTPVEPSYEPVVHLVPQVAPSAPDTQESAAAWADFWIRGMMVS